MKHSRLDPPPSLEVSDYPKRPRFFAAVLLLLALPVFLPATGLAQATFTFKAAPGVSLSNYFIYFQGSTASSGPADVTASYTPSGGGSAVPFSFGPSIISTNQVNLGSVASVQISKLNASRMYISYGAFGVGVTSTNAANTNYNAPSRIAGQPGSTNPFQFFEGNATGGTGNFDSTFIDAYSFTYRMRNLSTAQSSGLTNFDVQSVRQSLQAISVPSGGSYPNFVSNSAGKLVSILGNGNLTTPVQFAPLSAYLDSLANAQTLVKIGWNRSAGVAKGTPGSASGRTAIQKQYGINFTTNGTNYNTLAVWSEFDGRVVSRANAATLLAGTGFALNPGNDHGLLLTNGFIQLAFWGGTSTNTAASPLVFTNTNSQGQVVFRWTNASYFAQGAGGTSLNVLMRTAPQGTSATSFLSQFYSTNTSYGAFIQGLSAIAGITDGNIVEQQYLYIDDFYAALMMGLAGSTQTDPAGAQPGAGGNGTIAGNYSGWWWGWYVPKAFADAQPANTNFFDPWGAYFYNNSGGSSYGYAYSDRFIGDNRLLLNYTNGQTVEITVGQPLFGTSPGPTPTPTPTPTPVPGAPVVTSSRTAEGKVGTLFTYHITASNDPRTYGATGLPAGLSVNKSTGLISGRPTTAGTSAATIRAANSVGTGSAPLSITIKPSGPPPGKPPVVISSKTASGKVGVPFGYLIKASNDPVRFSAKGLPTGLTLDPRTGFISGRPGKDGEFLVNITASNAAGTGRAQLNLTVEPPGPPPSKRPVITSPSVANGKFSANFSYRITASNRPTRYSAQGLPAGLRLDAKTGVISGRLERPGIFRITIAARNAIGTGQAPLQLRVRWR